MAVRRGMAFLPTISQLLPLSQPPPKFFKVCVFVTSLVLGENPVRSLSHALILFSENIS